MKARKLRRCAILVMFGLAAQFPSVVRAQDKPALTPFIGETSAEFEARKMGLPGPAAAPEPSSLILLADPHGHFAVEPTINGSRIRMMVDTGASSIALSQRDARSIGINPLPSDYAAGLSTANGVVRVAPVLLREVAIGEMVVRDVAAVVVPEDKLQVSLLGMSFLSKLSSFEMSGGRLVLKR
jgi:aspartyl protease family protein